MNKNDTIKLIAIIVMAYPNFDKFKDENHIKALAEIWAEMFKDDDAELVSLAVKKHISTSKWPPSIAEIRDGMTDIQYPDLIHPDIAWETVVDLMKSKGEFCNESLYSILPPLIARVVETIGWSTLFEMRQPFTKNRFDMDRYAFMELYKPAYERARNEAMLPSSLSDGIKKATLLQSNGGLKLIADAEASRRKTEALYHSLELDPFSEEEKLIDENEQKALPGE